MRSGSDRARCECTQIKIFPMEGLEYFSMDALALFKPSPLTLLLSRSHLVGFRKSHTLLLS
jgi:hypothetical protein